MATIEGAIIEWVAQRPPWQREVLGRLVSGEVLTRDDIVDLADRLLAGDASFAEFKASAFPAPKESDPPISLLEIVQEGGVNALRDGERLTFSPAGLTVVFGNNGSGKSGFARLLKQLVRARHSEQVLPDVFDTARPENPKARVCVLIGDVEQHVAWPEESYPHLSRVSFYDEACGNTYIRTESEIVYRPPALHVLDGLIAVCDGVREVVDDAIAQNSASVPALPDLATSTPSGKFLAALSGDLPDEVIDAACTAPPDADRRIEDLADEEARLRVSNPEQERRRLLASSERLAAMQRQILAVLRRVGVDAIAETRALVEEAVKLRSAAVLATEALFSEELIDGVGSSAWRELWESARRFSLQEVYPAQPFPVTADHERCVLCQQELNRAAADRLRRFEAFVQDDTQRRADAAELAAESALAKLSGPIEMTADVTAGIDVLQSRDGDLAEEVELMLTRIEARRVGFLADRATVLHEELEDEARELDRALRELIEGDAAEVQALDQDGYDRRVTAVATERENLEAKVRLAQAREAVSAEVTRLRRRSELDEIRRTTATTGITTKATELTREHATDLVKDRFARESDRLRLERVTLADAGGTKGALQHRPALMGAVREASVPDVLSEGEQTALGLAGFFTQVEMEQSGSAVVLDDPVCSLDHVRRGYVASRLVKFAEDRQVVVFTHDVAFVSELKSAANEAGVAVTERSIERRGKTPGICTDAHPWKAKDVGERLGHLEAELARIERERAAWTEEEYEKQCSEWAGSLSETWERLIRLEIVDRVFDPASLEVRTKMFRVLAKISVDDDDQFQAAYGRCSKWARRHDKGVELNYVPPTVDEMSAELALVREFYGRIRKYKSES